MSYKLLDIVIEDIDGNIRVTAQELVKPTTPSFDLVLEEDASIVELLKPFLDAVWDPISKVFAPKGIVVKLWQISIACKALYCHLLDHDWPLVQINLPTMVPYTVNEALDMAVSYYKHLDRHSPPLLKQPFFIKACHSSNTLTTLLYNNSGNSPVDQYAALYLQNQDLAMMDHTNMLYLLHRTPVEYIKLCGYFEEALLVWFLTELCDHPPRKLQKLFVKVVKLSRKCLSLINEVVWRNPNVTHLFLESKMIPTFCKLKSTADLASLTLPEFNACGKGGSSVNVGRSTTYKPYQKPSGRIDGQEKWGTYRYLAERSNFVRAPVWLEDYPSSAHTTNLKCLVRDLVGVGHTLTNVQVLSLLGNRPSNSTLPILLPPRVHTLHLDIGFPFDRWETWDNVFHFPSHLRNLKLGEDCNKLRLVPMNSLLQPIATLPYLNKLEVAHTFLVEEPISDFPDIKFWHHLTHLSIHLANVKLAHLILASVPTTQWRMLNLKLDDDDPNRPGIFQGLEHADWGNLECLKLNYVDFVIHAELVKHVHNLVDFAVRRVPPVSNLISLLLEVLNPNTHPTLQTMVFFAMDRWKDVVKLSPDVVAELLQWPNLIIFPGSYQSRQGDWNRVRQSKLADLAARRLVMDGDFASPRDRSHQDIQYFVE